MSQTTRTTDALRILRMCLSRTEVKGSGQRQEIHFPYTEDVDDALLNFGITGFDDGDRLIVDNRKDIETLRSIGLVNFRDNQDFSGIRNEVIHLFMPTLTEIVDHAEYRVPVASLKGVTFPKHTPVPQTRKKAALGPTHTPMLSDEYECVELPEQLSLLEESWNTGFSDEEDNCLRDYTRLPNLKLFDSNYKWVKGILYTEECVDCEPILFRVDGVFYNGMFESARKGNQSALTELTKIHIGLLVSRVSKFLELYGGNADDLLQNGLMGFYHAIKKHNPDLGKFTTYAVMWIDAYIRRGCGAQDKLVWTPVSENKTAKRYHEVCAMLEQRLGRPLRLRELEKALDIDSKKLHKLQQRLASNCSYTGLGHDDQIGEGHIHFDIVNTSEVNLLREADDPFELASVDKLKDYVPQALSHLTKRQALVIQMRFGMNEAESELTLEEAGFCLGLSKERVRQIEAKALRMLRYPPRSEFLKQYLFEED